MSDEFPPLTSLRKMPLHSMRDMGEFACQSPERPRDGTTAYDWRCPRCVFAADMSIILQGDTVVGWKQHEGAESQTKNLSWMVARSTYWLPRLMS